MLSIRFRYVTSCRNQQQCPGLSPYRWWRGWDRCGEDKRRRSPRPWWTLTGLDMTDTTERQEAAAPATDALVLWTHLHRQQPILDNRCRYLKSVKSNRHRLKCAISFIIIIICMLLNQHGCIWLIITVLSQYFCCNVDRLILGLVLGNY